MSRRKQARPIRHLDDIDGPEGDAANLVSGESPVDQFIYLSLSLLYRRLIDQLSVLLLRMRMQANFRQQFDDQLN